MTKIQFIDALATKLGMPKTETAKIVDGLTEMATEALHKDGEITIPGLVKILVKDKPATGEVEKKNAFTGKMMTVKAKPASKKVLARPTGALKKSFLPAT